MTTILLVDDEVGVRGMWAIALRESGYRILEASDGVEGLHYARTKHPDLVISDLLMPTMGGFELARQIRTDPSTAAIPVVLITGIFQEEEGRRLAKACGVQQLLSKPCGRDKIIEVVANVLSTPSCQTVLSEDLDGEHLQLLNNTLVAKVRELETVNQRIEQKVAELQRVGQALRDKEEVLRHFSALVECSDDAIISKKLDGTILSWNPAAERIYGYTAAEVIGRSINLLAPPDGVSELQNVLERLGCGERLEHYETVRRRKDGRFVHVSLTISPVKNASGQLVAACTIARDVTERVRVENELRESRERFELAVRGATDGVWDANLVIGESYVSDRWCELMGYQRDEMPEGARLWQWVFAQIHPDDLAPVNDAVRRHWELREPYGVEFRMRTKSGEYRWFYSRGKAAWNPQGQAVRFAGCLTDVTQRKQAEEALQRAEQRYRKLFEQSPHGVVIIDPEESTFLEFNDVACRQLGYTREEFGPLSIGDIEAIETSARTRERIQQLFREGQVLFETEHRTKHGEKRKVIVTANVIELEGKKYIQSIVQDVTERKLTQEELRSSKERLEFLSRQLITAQESERQTLARELHDEIGQTLTAMRMLCETGSCSAGPRVLDLVTQLMGRVRNLSFDLRPPMLDPLGLLPAILWKLDGYSERTGIRVVFQHSGIERRFSSELEIAVYRIIQEALTNVARHAGVTEATVQLWADADTLGIQVTDRGKGFVPDAAMAAGRTGGLTGIRERVELLGGEMTIESSPGQGTFFTVQFPLATCAEHREGKQ